MAENGFRHLVFTKPEILLHATLRLLQLVLALTVAGIYGSSINSKKKPTGYDEIKWVWNQRITCAHVDVSISFSRKERWNEPLSNDLLPVVWRKLFQNYAVVIASFSAITSLVYVVPYVRRWVLWPWDCLLWRVVELFLFSPWITSSFVFLLRLDIT